MVYFEPFVGGANMIDKIKCSRRVGNDYHEELIDLFKQLQNGWTPPMHISEEEYNSVRDNKSEYPNYYVALVGFCATFGSKYFGGYARGFKADKTTPRDHPNEAIRNLVSQIPDIQTVEFISGDYLRFDMTRIRNCFVYCDPPYCDTTKYSTKQFNSDEFWKWVRDISKENFVLISEYNAPDDFQRIFSKDVTTSLKVVEHEKRTESLFTMVGGKYYEKYVNR